MCTLLYEIKSKLFSSSAALTFGQKRTSDLPVTCWLPILFEIHFGGREGFLETAVSLHRQESSELLFMVQKYC